mmetsp:Transcript_29491/g.96284  ORF Transcript_29491/g.96284 Transcript_29491/m.96284 type:complete len:80 (-) Transcript_29491:150-389(-)
MIRAAVSRSTAFSRATGSRTMSTIRQVQENFNAQHTETYLKGSNDKYIMYGLGLAIGILGPAKYVTGTFNMAFNTGKDN